MKNWIAALAVFAAVAARAQDPSHAVGGGCVTTKLQAVCSGAKLGTPAFAECSQKNLATVSASCGQLGVDHASNTTPKTFDPKNPCVDDAQRYCKGNWPGTPAADACLKTHQTELTPACAAFGHTNATVSGTKIEEACVQDAQTLCPGLTPGDGAKLVECMTQNGAKLSPGCRKARSGGKKKAKAQPVEKAAVENAAAEKAPAAP
jgi:hypothetical protein